jgi:hypothetical protein
MSLERDQFRRAVVANGWAREKDLPPGMPVSAAKWLVQMLARPVTRKHLTPRLVNSFMLGADPEFQLQIPHANRDEVNYNAEALGLKTGLAYGADMNGRLVEIRPYPSRFALEVVGSMLVTLRWMALLVPGSRELAWKAGAFTGVDGLGGHVHFGRKAVSARVKARDFEALDNLMALLTIAEVFSKLEVRQRYTHTKYGRPLDVRTQVHGYEYRTFPSWLGSPWEAYLALTFSKLALLDVGLLNEMTRPPNDRQTVRMRLRNLLAFYKGMDDDAAIAFQGLNVHGWPIPNVHDFKGAWGLTYPADVAVPKIQLLPTSIEASEEEICELRGHFLKGSALDAVVPVPNWRHTIPPGYKSVLAGMNTRGLKGMGEFCWDLVVSDEYPIKLAPLNAGGIMFDIAAEVEQLAPTWRDRIGEDARFCGAEPKGALQINIGSQWRDDPKRLAAAKAALMRCGFPIWTYMEVTANSLSEWRNGQKMSPVPVEKANEDREKGGKVYGKLIFSNEKG